MNINYLKEARMWIPSLEAKEKCKHWHLRFHKGKCKVQHLRRKNPRHQGQADLDGKNLSVLLDTKLNMGQRCATVAKRVMGVQGCIKGSVSSRSGEAVLPLHSPLVRTHLEYPIHFWAPHYKRHMDMLEWVQQTATKLMKDWKIFLSRKGWESWDCLVWTSLRG